MADPTELQPLQEDGQAPALARSLPPFGVRVGRSLWNAFREMPWPTRACASWLVLIVTAAIFADWIPGLQDPNYQGFLFGKGKTLDPPSMEHWLGTDNVSRDILARVVHGARTSLIFAGGVLLCGLVFGGLLGSAAGFLRGRFEAVVMFYVDVSLAFPALVFFLFAITMLNRRGLGIMTVAVSLLIIAPFTRIARANSLSVSNREFVTAARAIGTSRPRILVREIIPNVYPTLVAYSLVVAAVLILLEATLSFLGIGVPIPRASWGGDINMGRRDIAINVWPMIPPIFALVMTILSVNVVSDWLRGNAASRSSAL
ncbi:MAG: ABC transporter permease [Acidimicrobiales bacterium]|jgi:peptide/nickel transport system permease protein|nr:ABC transporter permease [Acidimicrobiales bacterium]|tara:strand:+ start:2710 stop:3654 length:945 start_codon:yes stop_codon:yes gene_type:complete